MSGFAIFPAVIRPEECAGLAELSTGRAGTRHLMGHPAVAQVAHDRRMMGIAQATLGPSAVPFRATLFAKTEQANWLIAWHQDTALPLESRCDAEGWGPWSTKSGVTYAHAPAFALEKVVALRLHLDPSTSDNGPLRVVPGSHQAGLLSDADVLAYAASHQQVECPAPLGGVIAMRPLLIHASAKSRNNCPRRVLHIEYATSLNIAPGIRLAVV